MAPVLRPIVNRQKAVTTGLQEADDHVNVFIADLLKK
jgi:hypothetical protein